MSAAALLALRLPTNHRMRKLRRDVLDDLKRAAAEREIGEGPTLPWWNRD